MRNLESVGRVYRKLREIVPEATKGEEARHVVAALMILALLIEKQRPGTNKQAVLDMVSNLYNALVKKTIDIGKLS